MKRIFTMLVLPVLTCLAAFAQGADGPKSIELTDTEHQLVVDNNNFAFNLFRQARGTESCVFSPLSITYALGMVNNGAAGKTQQQISTVLAGGRTSDTKGGAAADVATLNQFCLKMLTQSNLLDETTKVSIANNIYLNNVDDYRLKPAFKEAAKTYYGAEPDVRNLYAKESLDAINQWVSNQTEGMIPELLTEDDLHPNLVSFLLNAIYFKGAWARPFIEESTFKSYFDGTKATAMMMAQYAEYAYAYNDLYQAVQLPYGNGAYVMTVFLPRYGKTLDDLLPALDGQNWNSLSFKPCQVALYFPRIDTETSMDLVEVLKSLDMDDAFDGGEGFTDFCYVGADETATHPVWISLIKQAAKLKLDEKGTEAAAATVIEMNEKSMPMAHVEFDANRPFLYTISERSTGVIFFMGQYMGEPIKNARHDISLTADEKQLVKQNNDFAFRLFRETRGTDNKVLSPLSVTFALGMLNNGAAGQTQREINSVLGFGNADADAINQFCRKMLTETATLDKTTRVDIANTIFTNRDYQLLPAFIEQANTYYDAEPQTRDFHDGKTMDVINQWASDHTEGMIKKILDEETYNPDMVSYLLNAIYFKGVWADKFNPDDTRDEAFNGGDMLPMMHQRQKFSYTENDLYQSVVLPYGNRAYQMTVFLPREDKTIDDVLGALNGENWHETTYSYLVDLKLPRFETDSDIDLKSPLIAMGMPSAFDCDAARFDNFCDVATYIGLIKQSAKIKVNEEGTEAAAVTVIGAETTSVPLEATFHANRPFLYIISECSTGTIFFMGQYVGGSASRPVDITGIDMPQQSSPTATRGLYNLAGQRLNAQPGKGLYITTGGRKFVVR